MRWTEFSQKECIDMVYGKKLGSFSQADLSFDPLTGKIQTIWVPVKKSWFRRNQQEVKIDWRMIRKVGPEMVIIDSNAIRK